MRKAVRRRRIKEENRERQRYKGVKIKKEREGKGRKKKKSENMESRRKRGGRSLENTLHYNLSCFNYAIYTATMEGRPLWTTFSLTTGLEKGGLRGRVEVLSLSRHSSKHKPVWTEWHFTPAKSIPSLYTSTTEDSALSASACTYIDIKQRAAFSSSSL